MNLNWRTKPWGEAILVELEGEIDLHCAPNLKSALLELGSTASARVAIDLSGVSFLDSTGIGALVGALKKTRENGGQMAFFGARDRTKRVFQIAGLLSALPFYQTRDGALAALLPSPLPHLEAPAEPHLEAPAEEAASSGASEGSSNQGGAGD